MAKLRLMLLGGFEARTDSGFSLAIPLKKAQMLLAYLAMHPKQVHLRDKLSALLWGDSPVEQARHSLRQTLFAIRQALPADPMLFEGDSVAFAEEAVAVDVSEFELVARSDDPEGLEQAAALYQGDLLEGISPGSAQFEDWLRAERERLHELALEAFAKLLRHRMKLRATEPAIQTALRLLSLDPLQEVTHRALMRLYARQGRRAAALRQYQICVDILQRELGIEPEEATKQVYRELLPQPLPRIATDRAVDPHPPPQRQRRRLRSHRRSPRLTPPLIGRDADVDRLSQALAKACAGYGQAIALVGEAGIGKTRLITALREATTRRGAQTLIGRSYESERLMPLGPWVQAIREVGIVGSRALKGLSAGWLADLSYLFPELRPPEWPLPPGPIEAVRLFDAMTELVKSLASRQPLVLVLEDLHWADEMSVRLFSFLGRRLENRRILLVGTVREEELHGASCPVRRMLAELSQEERLVRLVLAPLSREHTRVLVRRLAEGSSADEASLTRLEDRVWTLSEGNPLVIVESLREALDTARRLTISGLPALPDKIRELIIGRFERLTDASQHVLTTAAVIGRDFEFRLLQRAADVGEDEAASAVEALVRAQILQSVGERFDFTHDRLREVAYGRLLPTRRRMVHAQVVAALEDVYVGADTIETVHRDRLSEHVEQLAHHALRAEVWEKAVEYSRHAGTKAFLRSAHLEAVACFEQALDALQHMPETRQTCEQAIDLRSHLGNALVPLGKFRRILNELREAQRLAEELADHRRLGRVSSFMSGCLFMIGGHQSAVALGHRALDMAVTLNDFPLQVRTSCYLGQAYHDLGDYRQASDVLRRTIDRLQGDLLQKRLGMAGLPAVFCRTWLIWCLAELGDFTAATTYATEAARIAERIDNPFTLAVATLGPGILYLRQGIALQAIAALERGLEVCRGRHISFILPWVASALGAAYTLAGRIADAVPLLEQAVEQAGALGITGRQALQLTWLSEAYLLGGRTEQALASAESALELARQQAEEGHHAYILRLLGDIAARREPSRVERPAEFYGEALSLAIKLAMRPLMAHSHTGLAKLYRHTDQHDEADEHFRTAATMYRDMGMTYWVEKLREDTGAFS